MDKIFQIPIYLCLTPLWLAVVENLVMAGSEQLDPVKDSTAVSESAVSESSPSLKVVNELISNTDEDGSKDVSAGDTLTYRITVTNNGTANLTNVTVDVDLTGTVDALCVALLAPGANCSVNVQYQVTQADVEAGVIKNTGSGNSDQTLPVDDPQTVPVPTPSLMTEMVLSSNADEDGSQDISAGDTLTYRITVANTGTANLTNVTVGEDLTGTVAMPCAALLTPGVNCSVDVQYQVTSADVVAGVINNTGTGGQ